jgi:hypothetical protein
MTEHHRKGKIEERQTSGEEIPPEPVLARQGDRPGAGSDTPSGPATRRTTTAAKRERRKQDATRSKESKKPSR